ncbi:alpha/beta hydrolase family protein [Dyadobacter psychrotolerans]|uniref:Alpha/beta hydrolase n=1 Tax=Dyadobacter psychrotolerans TaxID=2541721 RepID=A0A4R5DM42_9BACT|nr:alpha/beta hydrolase [Dyadobacter psychrotolerans]TDE15189.1 alpha/beta hydrolase [Dyadobacter psychrotolerans]
MKNLSIVMFFALSTLALRAQDVAGQWNGILKVQGMQLRIVFNITRSDKGYVSTLDSPDQKATGIPVTTTSFENQVLKLTIANAGISYEGTMDKTNVIVGTFKQGGQAIALNLSSKMPDKEKISRPQEPIKPYPYYSEDVTFENRIDNIVLAGTLTLPKEGGSNFPAVILISGSGPQNRDEELLSHKPFLVLSDHLTKSGIAVLRFDDRGTAMSKGNFQTATTRDLARDVQAAVSYLLTRKEIDKAKIGLAGHSEGGIIAPMVASESKDVSFIVMLAGTGIPGDQLLLLQQELIGRASGLSEQSLAAAKNVNKAAYDIVGKSSDSEKLKTDLTTFMNKQVVDNPEWSKSSGLSQEQFVSLQVKELTKPWMIYFIKYDPAPALQNIKCPVLAVNGEKDLQVPSKENLSAIKAALEKAGNKKVTIKELVGLNHLFQECKTGSPSEYAVLEQTFSPVALNEVSEWILRTVK